jgi:hypothetical protein
MNIFSHVMMADPFSAVKPDAECPVRAGRNCLGMSAGAGR